MPYFLSTENLELDKESLVSGEEARHISLSHRIKNGEKIKLQGKNGKRFLAQVLAADKKSLKVKTLEQLDVPAESKVKITLFQSIVSEKALDFIFQKGTELGVSKIVLFNSANTATKLSQEIFKDKLERWNKILSEAAKQSERSVCPELVFSKDVSSVVELMDQEKVFLADANGQKISQIKFTAKTIGFIVGPEGGFTEQEINIFKSLPNSQAILLSNFVLRSETAAISGLAVLQNLNS
jgi:16S rRNA (uracil1498-N3)-methyltransferase